MPVSLINSALMRLQHRAEKFDHDTLVSTFVDVGPLFPLLQSLDHQVVYGRRGTGKTHALQLLVAARRKQGDLAVYVDMRTVGSTGGLYADTELPIAERGTRLILDTLGVLHDQLVDFALAGSDAMDSTVLPLLDSLANQISEVRVVAGEVELTTTVGQEMGQSTARQVGADLGVTPRVGASLERTSSAAQRAERVTREVGQVRTRLHFGAVGKLLGQVLAALIPNGRLWLVLDEWADVPADLQPVLADLLRRAVFPVPQVVVKIGAIEHRCRFGVLQRDGSYMGIELGADASANVNLDDFMVFDNDAERASAFFRELFFKHVKALLVAEGLDHADLTRAEDFVAQGFTQVNAFGELVRSAEGVPRDALFIASVAAQAALDRRIAMSDVRTAARRWYQRDKEAMLSEDGRNLLNWIMDRVIRDRRARAFFLEEKQGRVHPLIGALYDQRVLHIVKKSVATYVEPGVRYDVYGLDYGCYVDLMATGRAPRGLFEAEDVDGAVRFFDVPQNDYRSIRRAILDLSEFEAASDGS